MYLPFILCIISSLGIILGFFYRWSALIFFTAFTYVELIDKSYYLNHYYFVSIVSFLLILVPANRLFSLDIRLRRKSPLNSVPAWTIDLFKFQLGCVYFFSGIAKINYDWLLEAQPMRTWLQANHHLPVVGDFFQAKSTAFIFSWLGFLYDLLIVFLLLNKSSRKLAYVTVIIFHLLTWILFPIGIFPWVMIFSTLIFFSPQWHEKLLSRFTKAPNSSQNYLNKYAFKTSIFTPIVVVIFVLSQLLIPFRYILYPGNLFWTEEGFRFSWRVMLMHKEGLATFYVKDGPTQRKMEINAYEYLTPSQYNQMATQPDFILQFGKFLKSEYENRKFHFGINTIQLKNVSVHAQVYVSLNGRNSRKFVDEKHNLCKIPYNLNHRTWIESFE
jgi:hypothetical protein